MEESALVRFKKNTKSRTIGKRKIRLDPLRRAGEFSIYENHLLFTFTFLNEVTIIKVPMIPV